MLDHLLSMVINITNCITNIYVDSSFSAATNSGMELLSVICFNQANKQHVCYSRSGSTWLFHDSMSTRTQSKLSQHCYSS